MFESSRNSQFPTGTRTQGVGVDHRQMDQLFGPWHSPSQILNEFFFKYGCEITINLFISQVGNADGWEEQESRGIGRGFEKFEMEKYWQSLAL